MIQNQPETALSEALSLEPYDAPFEYLVFLSPVPIRAFFSGQDYFSFGQPLKSLFTLLTLILRNPYAIG